MRLQKKNYTIISSTFSKLYPNKLAYSQYNSIRFQEQSKEAYEYPGRYATNYGYQHHHLTGHNTSSRVHRI
jgi:hypothetical protein